jgi:phosphatidylserine/phosphatidylglycerophosphate/cardiolipin synthase-like enzyme
MRNAAAVLLFGLLSGCAWGTPPAMPAPGPAGGLWQDAAIFRAAGQVLASARTRILVEMYEFGRPDLAEELLAARARGAEVRTVLDPTVPETVATGRRLSAAGLAVRFYPVDDRSQQIDHVKLLVGDGAALVGGMNWGASSARNHDYALLLTSPGQVARLAAIFEQDWALAGGDPRPLPPTGGEIAQTAPGSEIRALLGKSLASARFRIEAEVFDLTDPETQLALQLAHRRGVAVRVLLDPAQDVNRASFGQLREGGVQVRWFRPPPGAKLHAKAVLADALLVLGSANWSVHGLEVNHELDVATSDAEAVRAYGSRFETDWDAAA